MTSTKGKNIKYVDILKALGIISVVVGHSGAVIFHNYIYLYHMALFYFIAGYLYKDENSKKPIRFIIKKIKSLYIPYIGFGLFYLAIHNFLYNLNIYSNKTGYQNYVSSLYSKQDFLNKAKNIIKFKDMEQLGGALWFLEVLFFALVIFCILSFFIERYITKDKEYIRALIILCLFVLGNILTKRNKEINQMLNNRSLVALMIVYIGYLYKNAEKYVIMNKYIFVCALITLILNSKYGQISLNVNWYPDPSFLIISSIAGIYANIYLAKKISEFKYTKLITYIGKSSLTIMATHFLCFKLTSLLQIYIYKKPIYQLASFPIISGNGIWWILYSLSGIILPVAFKSIFNYIYNKAVNIRNRNAGAELHA